MPLYLLPNLLGPVRDHSLFLPVSVDRAVAQLDGLIAESEGGGRSYLKRFTTRKKPHEMPIALLTKGADLEFILEPVRKGEHWGVVSDCGLPCIADPGARLVQRARQLRIPLQTFSGPSSLTMALILSGLSAQAFTFHGYIPKEPERREEALRSWEKVENMTHLFIEAPYRNLHTYRGCLQTLQAQTLFSMAASLTLPEEWIYTDTIGAWKGKEEKEIEGHLHKQPTIFLFFVPPKRR